MPALARSSRHAASRRGTCRMPAPRDAAAMQTCAPQPARVSRAREGHQSGNDHRGADGSHHQPGEDGDEQVKKDDEHS